MLDCCSPVMATDHYFFFDDITTLSKKTLFVSIKKKQVKNWGFVLVKEEVKSMKTLCLMPV